MVEEESSLIDEDIVIKSRFQLKDNLANFYHRISSSTKNFVDYQIPAVGDNLKSWVKSFRGGVILVAMLLVIIIPILLNDGTYYDLFIVAMIYAIYAASWDLLAGVTGQVSFGHSAFFGIGSYAFAFFLMFFQLHWFWAILFAAISSVAIGLIIAVPALRLKGPYLALGTMAFSLFLYYLFQFPELQAESVDLPLSFKIFRWSSPLTVFLIVLVFMIISVVIMLVVYNSKLGTIFKGIRDDEYATEASGINTTKFKLYSFIISSFFAAVAGSLYAFHLTNVSFHNYSNVLSFYPVIFTLLGGIATISGAVMGAYTFAILTQAISELMDLLSVIFPGLPAAFTTQIETISVFIFAIILLLIIRFSERGIMEPAIRHTKSLWDVLLGK
ncbi:MAG: branched-chain amino acid ABC transporter permease [Candidatus Thorarchaeota archaeon]